MEPEEGGLRDAARSPGYRAAPLHANLTQESLSNQPMYPTRRVRTAQCWLLAGGNHCGRVRVCVCLHIHASCVHMSMRVDCMCLQCVWMHGGTCSCVYVYIVCMCVITCVVLYDCYVCMYTLGVYVHIITCVVVCVRSYGCVIMCVFMSVFTCTWVCTRMRDHTACVWRTQRLLHSGPPAFRRGTPRGDRRPQMGQRTAG